MPLCSCCIGRTRKVLPTSSYLAPSAHIENHEELFDFRDRHVAERALVTCTANDGQDDRRWCAFPMHAAPACSTETRSSSAFCVAAHTSLGVRVSETALEIALCLFSRVRVVSCLRTRVYCRHRRRLHALPDVMDAHALRYSDSA